VIVNPDELGATRDDVVERLERNDIITRKYFHPLVCNYPQYIQFKTKDLPVAEKIAGNVLCLPLFHDIEELDIHKVVNVLINL
jgi:dTDP-4-amino-4,6-dideoxygalactose transaminase